jgi:hypothetical protein
MLAHAMELLEHLSSSIVSFFVVVSRTALVSEKEGEGEGNSKSGDPCNKT